MSGCKIPTTSCIRSLPFAINNHSPDKDLMVFSSSNNNSKVAFVCFSFNVLSHGSIKLIVGLLIRSLVGEKAA